MDPIVSFYDNDSTPTGGTVIDNSNPIAFGVVNRSTTGTPSNTLQSPFHLWNDKNGGTAKTMKSVKIGVKDSSGGNTGQFISGTAGNGNIPFFSAKSQGSSGCPDDGQVAYTVIGGANYLSVGDIPANARRSIWLQCSVPADATSGSALLGSIVVVEYTFDS